MILVADSGSTKTHWALIEFGVIKEECITLGINPFFIDKESIVALLSNQFSLSTNEVSTIYFYGAGCTPTTSSLVEEALRQYFDSLASPRLDIFVESDLIGAARALFGNTTGVVGILGTGANSCLYIDGEIKNNVPPLGFVLGDEASGAYWGKQLLADYLRGIMPDELQRSFSIILNRDYSEVLQKVYKESFPNRFLASLAPFLYKHRVDDYCQNLLRKGFSDFFERNILLYGRADIPLGFVGSVAYYFSDELNKVATQYGFNVQNIMLSPMDGLAHFYALEY